MTAKEKGNDRDGRYPLFYANSKKYFEKVKHMVSS